MSLCVVIGGAWTESETIALFHKISLGMKVTSVVKVDFLNDFYIRNAVIQTAVTMYRFSHLDVRAYYF